MKKSFLRVMSFAVIAALVSIGCSDNGVQNKNPEVGEFLKMFTGGGNAAYTLTVNVSPAEGTVSRNPNADSYKAGTTVTVTVTPKAGYEFLGWSGALNSSDAQVTITMNSDKTLTAGFQREGSDLPTYEVYFNANGATGGAPSTASAVSGNSITLPGQGNMEKSEHSFGGWNTNNSGTGTNYAAGTSYTVNGNVTLYAKWTPYSYTLTTSASPSGGGTVSRSPNQTSYTSGTSVTVTATAASGYTFTGWSRAASGTTNPLTITMNGDKSLTANFQQQPTTTYYTLTTSASPSGGGTVSRSPNQNSYTSGTNVTVTATASSGYTFTGWSGASSSTSSSVTITMNGDKSLTANFEQQPTTTYYTLTTSASPSGGGTVSRSPNQTSYTSGTSVTVTATAASGYTFTGWSGASTSTSSSVSITMNGDKSLTANFQQQPVTPPVTGSNNCGTASSCKKVTIGGKRWMAENLNIETANSWCYDNDPANCGKYGRLYTWSAALTACPSGWHLPTRQEWGDLAIAAGGTGAYGASGTAGRALKSVTGWNSYSGIVNTDEFGFSALPGGYRFSDGSFYNVGNVGRWWTAMEGSGGYAYFRDMGFRDDYVYEYDYPKEIGSSVRCVED